MHMLELIHLSLNDEILWYSLQLFQNYAGRNHKKNRPQNPSHITEIIYTQFGLDPHMLWIM